jgi:NAD(P)-dependent dehydrogenase (short-subunit alcohol dehydrogenase family)
MNLEGKTALIVGASRGIGRRVAELFSRAGANVVISSRNDLELMELEFKLNNGGNAEVLAIAADAAEAADVESLVSHALEKFGSIDYLIVSAGSGILKSFEELTVEDLDNSFSANTRSVFNTLKAVLPAMKERKYGRVIAIPGILGKAPMMNASAYCASKYALTGMIKCLKDEYRRHGIRFSLMHFGGVDSTFWDNVSMKVDRSKMLSVDAAARAVFFAATQEGEGVMSEVVLLPESHQLV